MDKQVLIDGQTQKTKEEVRQEKVEKRRCKRIVELRGKIMWLEDCMKTYPRKIEQYKEELETLKQKENID